MANEQLPPVCSVMPIPAVQIDMPDGLIAMGDSVMALNPVHGQGITVSMMGAELLRDVLAKRLAAKSSASNPALALRGLAKVPCIHVFASGRSCRLGVLATADDYACRSSKPSWRGSTKHHGSWLPTSTASARPQALHPSDWDPLRST